MPGKYKDLYRKNKMNFKMLRLYKAAKQRYIRKKRRIEYKQYTLGAGFTAFYSGAGGVFTHLTGMGQGVQDTQRVGDRVTVRGLHLRIGIQNNNPGAGTVANPFTNARVMIFQYKNSDMAPVNTELFLNGGGLGVTNTYSARNIDYLDKYVVLYDRIVQVRGYIGAPAAAFAGVAVPTSYMKNIKIRVPLKYMDKVIRYQAAGTNTNNGLWLYITSDNATVANNPLYTFDSNLTYTDQ